MHEEFTDVWCFDLRGNGRVTGDGRNIFEYPGQNSGGTRTPVAIIILVRNPTKTEHAIQYSSLEDKYYAGEDKRNRVKELGSIRGINDWQIIKPDKYHDWLDQRDDAFVEYLPMGSKGVKSGKKNAIFRIYSNGIQTNRDVWIYNSSKSDLSKNMKLHINYCNSQDLKNPTINPQQAKWTGELSDSLTRLGTKPVFEKSLIRTMLYRPFFKQYAYFETKAFIHRPSKMSSFFPTGNSENLVICVPYKFTGNFYTFITDVTPDLEVTHHGLCFPLYTYEQRGKNAIQMENITDHALIEYRLHYNDAKIGKIDIFYYVYGLLHQPKYRKKYANSLSKGLPHIPMASDFWAFRNAGKALADLHLSYFDEHGKDNRHPLGPSKNDFGKPAKMAFAKLKDPDTGRQATDYTRLKINGILAYDNIPETDYRVNGRTPLEWLADRYKFTTNKESGITNDPCENLTEDDMISMVERAVHVGVRSDEIVRELPKEFETAEWTPKKTGLDAHIDLGGPTQSVL